MMSGGAVLWSSVRVLCYRNRVGSQGGNHWSKNFHVGCRYLCMMGGICFWLLAGIGTKCVVIEGDYGSDFW